MFQHNPGSPVGVGGSIYPTHTNEHRGRPAPGGRNSSPPPGLSVSVTGSKNHVDVKGLLDAAGVLLPVGSVAIHVDGDRNTLEVDPSPPRSRAQGWFLWESLPLVVSVVDLALSVYNAFGPC